MKLALLQLVICVAFFFAIAVIVSGALIVTSKDKDKLCKITFWVSWGIFLALAIATLVLACLCVLEGAGDSKIDYSGVNEFLWALVMFIFSIISQFIVRNRHS